MEPQQTQQTNAPKPRISLSDDQVERYARHLILKGVGVRGQKRLLAAKVLIVGAGGLGSPVALYLAAAGVGTLGIVDDDVVDMSNLQRQIIHDSGKIGTPKAESARESIARLNPDVTVNTYVTSFNADNAAELIADYDVVVDATDNFAAKFLINDACVLAGKPFVHGGVVQFAGQVMDYVPGEGPCYRCIFREMPAAGEVPTCKEAGVLGAAVGVIGSLQAVEVVKMITGAGDLLTARMLTADLLTMRIRTVPLPEHEPDCPVCGDHPTITALEPDNYIQPACAI
ncbi:adenylyltransferase [Bifidobacterium callimiconis]|uniref:Adenylyltransferase n=1 Tax=Bifidobacterium callimiconis TaxID=2306973 RepID=A0A430FCV4_9BIFI|nr:HesA/MoeB/ThiF family protein [Bifidobacterium callimiconis]RSX50622.1 adenylyltransferase [Bifidobacterium callimiconis]